MSNNVYNNVAAITGAIAECLENKLTFAKHAYHGFDDSFKDVGVKHGDTINLRVPGFATYRTGPNANPGVMNDTYVPLTITQAGSDFKLTTAELRLNMDDLKKQRLDAMAARVASEIDYAGMALYTQIPNAVGTPGTAQTNLLELLTAGAKLTSKAVPPDARYNVMHPLQQPGIINGMSGTFNPAADISEQYRKGNLGYAAGLAHSVDGQCPTHTFGTWGGTPLVNGTTADGATTLVTDGWSSGASTLNLGDIFTVAGVYDVNPITKRSTGFLKQFVVTATVSDTAGAMTIAFSPAMTLTGATQNISALPVNDAAVTPLAASGKVSPVSFIGHEQAFVMGSADLELPYGPGSEMNSRVKIKDLNMSLRLVKYYNGDSDSNLYRFDVVFGWCLYRPQFVYRNHN